MIEALNFRCLRHVAQPMADFHILVGPNASGKTTFLDVVAFLGDLVSGGLQDAISARTHNFSDLVWRREEHSFELAIELEFPPNLQQLLEKPSHRLVRYEVEIGMQRDSGEVGILAEKVLLLAQNVRRRTVQRALFPAEAVPPRSILTRTRIPGGKTIVNKARTGNDNFYDETGKGWDHVFKLGPRKSALANLPEDETGFPVATWLKGVLSEGVQRLALNSLAMRRPSPPGQPRGFLPDGSNLPWLVARMRKDSPDQCKAWIQHLRTALPEIQDIDTIERQDDKHRYLLICYEGGLKLPSWTASDGTLRLLALTLPAYLPNLQGVFLIEEPENGIHPRGVESVFQSLSSVYAAQVLLATHSPVVLGIAEPAQVLCFARTESGATDIVPGDEHPALKNWKRETNLGVLFAGGVLG
jgi:predicted ATPase